MTQSLSIIIVNKNASLKSLTVKDYKVEDLYKKCGFKKSDGFNLQVEWIVKLNKQKYLIQMYGKLNGKANTENKYDFPPPIDKNLYFGSCALICMCKDNNNTTYINLSIELWNKIYDKLFGGFEDLALTCDEDEAEEDILDNVPKHMKTKKGGYLKDGFVVDSSDAEDDLSDSSDEEEINSDLDKDKDIIEGDDDVIIEDIGSELSEEIYIDESD
jgi:hypothetical protein